MQRVMAERSALHCVLEHSESGIAYRTALFFAALTMPAQTHRLALEWNRGDRGDLSPT